MTDTIPTKKRKITIKETNSKVLNYEEYNGDEPIIKELDKLLDKIFPSPTIKEYAMTLMSGCLTKKIKNKVIIPYGNDESKVIFRDLILKTFDGYNIHVCFDELKNDLRRSFNSKDYRLIYMHTDMESNILLSELFDYFVSGGEFVCKELYKNREKTKLECAVMLNDYEEFTFPCDRKIIDKLFVIPFTSKVKYPSSTVIESYVQPMLWLLINKYDNSEKLEEYSKIRISSVTKYISDDICDQIWGLVNPQF